MRFAVLSSGSRANSTFVEAGGVRLLIDCGLSPRQTEKRLLQNGIALRTLQAILVTHEHSDHIRSVAQLSRLLRVPVYGTRPVLDRLDCVFGKEAISPGEVFCIGACDVLPFRIPHDAAEPVAFVLEGDGVRLGHCTDLGHVTPAVRAALSRCHALLLEFNHDEGMLWGGEYPWHLKNRIASDYGHLSNNAAGELLHEIRHGDLTHVVLGHLSENNNSPELALRAAQGSLHGCDVSIECASPKATTALLDVGGCTKSANSVLSL